MLENFEQMLYFSCFEVGHFQASKIQNASLLVNGLKGNAKSSLGTRAHFEKVTWKLNQ